MRDDLVPKLPASLEAERALLGSILIDGNALAVAREIVPKANFFLKRIVFETINSLSEKGRTINLVTLAEELSSAGLIEKIGGAAYLASLTDGLPAGNMASVKDYANIITEKAFLRRAARVGNDIRESALRRGADVPSLLQGCRAALACLEAGSPTRPDGAGAVGLWSGESMATFLESEEDSAECLYARILYRETSTEIFSPRGIGKSLFALHLAVSLARKGLRVLLLDRDNPRRVVKARVRAFGADPELKNLKAITREKCPPLTRPDLWAAFPYNEYDVVILDSFDSMAEGVGEQDSSKPSSEIASSKPPGWNVNVVVSFLLFLGFKLTMALGFVSRSESK
jgi:hypothetical protein